MKIPPCFDYRTSAGYVLIMTLAFVAVSLIAFSSIMWSVSSNAKTTRQNELFTTAQAAADGATEEVVAQLDYDWTYSKYLSDASAYQSLVPASTYFPNINFSDGSGNASKTGLTIGVRYFTNQVGSTYAHLAGYVQDCNITSTATTFGQAYTVSATVHQLVGATIIPLFQFAVFYNLDLDVSPGQPMTINGPVFCNGIIWMWPYASMTFNSTVGSALVVTNHMQPYDQQSSSGYVAPTYKVTGQPQSHLDSLTMPIGTNNNPSAVEAIINLPPAGLGAPLAAAYTTNGSIYQFNLSDLIISNSAAGLSSTCGTNITIWFQDSVALTTHLTPVTNDLFRLKTGGFTNIITYANGARNSRSNVAYSCYSFVTNVQFYDFRESDTVQAVQVDIDKFNDWLTNTSVTGGLQYNKTCYSDGDHGIRSMFIYNSVPRTSSQLPAVRLINGFQLPYTTDPNGSARTSAGLTVVTPQPVYAYGNYNVQVAGGATNAAAGTTNTAGNTYPAAIMADAITILSSKWNDTGSAYLSGGSLGSRSPVPTTLNAACLEGIVVSTNDGSGNLHYSGGIENFLRLEENWSSSTVLTYNGSIVVMFPSIYATGFWQVPGNYYNVPTRKWAFDLNFNNPNLLPPNTPQFFKIIRKDWDTD